MKEKEAIRSKIVQAIQEDILNDVPPTKKEEFTRGFCLYLEKEEPDLYQAFTGGDVGNKTLDAQLQESIQQFATMVKEKKEGGRNHA